MVEDERGKMFASCSEVPRPGMVIHTNTKKLQQYRKLIIELLLSTHCRDCTTCTKNGMCELQSLAYRVGVHSVRFENKKEQLPIDMQSPGQQRGAGRRPPPPAETLATGLGVGWRWWSARSACYSETHSPKFPGEKS